MIRDSYPDNPNRDRPSLSASPIFVCTALAGLILFTLWFLGTKAYHFTDLQMAEFLVYFLLGIGVPGITIWVLMKRREWKENQRRYPPLVMSPAADAKHVEKAWNQNAVVLGYDVHGTPWLWPDKVRVMQGIVVGMTGSGKTTLLRNIITQDLTTESRTCSRPAQDPDGDLRRKGRPRLLLRAAAAHQPGRPARRSASDQSGAARTSRACTTHSTRQTRTTWRR